MTIRTSPIVEEARWFDIWAAFQTVVGMCSSIGEKGMYTELGKSPCVFSTFESVTIPLGLTNNLFIEVTSG